jgi:hypothetical protein
MVCRLNRPTARRQFFARLIEVSTAAADTFAAKPRAGSGVTSALPPARTLAQIDQLCGTTTSTIQGTPNLSVHMPNRSPHICFSKGIVTVPLSESLSQ